MKTIIVENLEQEGYIDPINKHCLVFDSYIDFEP